MTSGAFLRRRRGHNRHQLVEATLAPGSEYQAYPDLSSARAGAREASCADFGVAVWDFNPKPE